MKDHSLNYAEASRGRYPGGKNGSGVLQRIINQIPPHRVTIEAFAGSAGLLATLRPAARQIAIDCDAAVIAAIGERVPETADRLVVDALKWLPKHRWTGEEFLFVDPPYLPETRSDDRRLYQRELTRLEHVELLEILLVIAARGVPVMVCGYPSELYDWHLRRWRRITYTGTTRGGPRTECLWLSYPEPIELHDYRYLGENFRQRERIRRKQRRWSTRLARMDRLERQALLAAIAATAEASRASPEAATGSTGSATAGNGEAARSRRPSPQKPVSLQSRQARRGRRQATTPKLASPADTAAADDGRSSDSTPEETAA